MPAVPAALAIKQTPMGNFCLSEEKRAVLHKLGWARTGMSQTGMEIRGKSSGRSNQSKNLNPCMLVELCCRESPGAVNGADPFSFPFPPP